MRRAYPRMHRYHSRRSHWPSGDQKLNLASSEYRRRFLTGSRWVKPIPGRKPKVGNTVWSGPFSDVTDSQYQPSGGGAAVLGADEGILSGSKAASLARRS